MKLSRTVSYAVRATLQLARNHSSLPVPCSKLATDGHMPERFLLQILRVLVTHGILKSTRGVEGGYSLSRPADQISLLDVIEAIDGPLDNEPEAVTAEGVGEEFQNLQSALKQITVIARKQLQSIKLSQLLEPPEMPLGSALQELHTETTALHLPEQEENGKQEFGDPT